jgi:predicted histone-like DNA-binding protein
MAQLTLKVKKVPNKNLRTQKAGFASRAIANGVATFDDICKLAATNTTLHPKELGLAFGLALDAIRDELKNGKIIELDQIGRLYPAITSHWTETQEEQTLDGLTKRVAYRPSQEITAAIAGAKLAWATAKEAAESDTDGTDTGTDDNQGGGSTPPQGGELEG